MPNQSTCCSCLHACQSHLKHALPQFSCEDAMSTVPVYNLTTEVSCSNVLQQIYTQDRVLLPVSDRPAVCTVQLLLMCNVTVHTFSL